MNGDVAEINVQQLRVVRGESLLDPLCLAARYLPGRVLNRAIPKAPQEMQRGPRHHFDRRKRKFLRVLPFPRDHDLPEVLQCRELPVDVEHLRFQESRAVGGDNRARIVRHA